MISNDGPSLTFEMPEKLLIITCVQNLIKFFFCFGCRGHRWPVAHCKNITVTSNLELFHKDALELCLNNDFLSATSLVLGPNLHPCFTSCGPWRDLLLSWVKIYWAILSMIRPPGFNCRNKVQTLMLTQVSRIFKKRTSNPKWEIIQMTFNIPRHNQKQYQLIRKERNEWFKSHSTKRSPAPNQWKKASNDPNNYSKFQSIFTSREQRLKQYHS